VICSDDGRHVVSFDTTGLIRFYDLDHPVAQLAKTSAPAPHVVTTYANDIDGAATLPDGGIAVSGMDSQSPNEPFGPTLNGDPDQNYYLRICNASMVKWRVKVGQNGSLCLSQDRKSIYDSGQFGLDIVDLSSWTTTHLETPSGTPIYDDASSILWTGSASQLAGLTPGDAGNDPTFVRFNRSLTAKARRTIVHRERKIAGIHYVLQLTAASHDGKLMAALWNVFDGSTEAEEGMTEIYDVASGKRLSILKGPYKRPNYGYDGAFEDARFSADDKTFAAEDQLGRIILWNVSTSNRIGQLSETKPDVREWTAAYVEPFMSSSASYAMFDFSPDGQSIAAARDDGSVYIYSLKSGLPIAEPAISPVQLEWIGYSADARTLYGFSRIHREVNGHVNSDDVVSMPTTSTP